jgi:hypothetical protein
MIELRRRRSPMSSVITPTKAELEDRRKALVAGTKMSERELRRRAESYQLGASEADVLREIDEIDYLLGA